ncbi:MAPEG family protein [Microbulbifer sp. VAAF005]|uniref:MAPEG family protein n=1 Tax=Microbulbifer sp. VAAF005 TaxID=3034230 RepID=UPI0024AE676B|nr:MAPEG family protein [Microbulbifer sp. VAAF005]WHI46089.1 MAPEG family protein [Microbulbifer sp. VAAF005]
MIESAQIIQPVIALICWSMVMWLWMYATRLPAVKKAKLKLDPNAPRGEQMSTLPPHVRWKADNYNHLMEQPTIFYALAISLAVLGAGDGINFILAWTYVGIRVIHSIVQVTFNKIEIRFLIFALSNIPLLALTVNAVRITFMQ